MEIVDNSYFVTEENVGMLKMAKEANSILFDYRVPLDTCRFDTIRMSGLPISVYAPETVGCVVVDGQGTVQRAHRPAG